MVNESNYEIIDNSVPQDREGNKNFWLNIYNTLRSNNIPIDEQDVSKLNSR